MNELKIILFAWTIHVFIATPGLEKITLEL